MHQLKAARLLDQLHKSANQVDLAVQEDILLEAPDNLDKFYDRLRDVKQFHRLNPVFSNAAHLESLRSLELSEDQLDALFSGEEMFGKYLDMTTLHAAYLALPQAKKLKYTTYLEQFSQFDMFDKQTKASKEFQAYVADLKTYLESYLRRAQPLLDFIKFKQHHVKLFNAESQNGAAAKKGSQHLIAMAEFLVQAYAKHLDRTVQDTKEYATSKQVMTERERMELFETAPSTNQPDKKPKEEEEEEGGDGKIYNPLNIPLGWDGKPIPYWLYRLHGLGVEYHCEICGNFTYYGRKNFDNHFQEWRHAHGMRCLGLSLVLIRKLRRTGIPNSRHFRDVTQIQDAVDCNIFIFT